MVKKRVIATVIFLGLSGSAAAQSDGYITNGNQRGVVPFGSYQLDAIDNVNLGTGAAGFTIPLYTRKGRGLDYGSQIGYSSKLWVFETIYGNPQHPDWPTAYQWRKTLRPEALQRGVYGELDYQEQFYDCPYAGGFFTARVRSNFSYTDSTGANYRFPNRDYRASQSGSCSAVPNYLMTVGNSDNGVAELNTSGDPYVIRFKDGRRLEIPFLSGTPKLQDVNGNFIANGLDTVGRGLSLKDSDGVARNFVTTYSTLAVTTAFPTVVCGGLPINRATTTISILTRLDLPNGLAFTFQYDPTFGEISRVNLPTGGYIRYEWTTLAQFDDPPDSALACGRLDSRRVWKRHVSYDGATEQTWTYAYARNATTGDYTTTVTDPLGNVTVHTFMPDGLHETKTEIRQGAATILRTIDNTWRSDTAPVQSHNRDDQFDYDAKNWRLATVTSKWNATNQVSREEYAWDGDSSASVESHLNLLEKKERDYGSSAPGAVKRRTVYTYLHDSNANYLNRHILDRVAFTTVYDGDPGSVAAQSEIRYDTRTLTVTTGVVQHDYAGYGSTMNIRGNPTEERRWLNTDGSWLATVHDYDDLGNRVSTTDPKGYKTTFGYADSWWNSACAPAGGTARAYLTQTTAPLSLTTTWKYYSCSSLQASVTDPNLKTTTFAYDAVDRLKRTVFPDAGESNVFYSDLNLATTYQGAAVFPAGTTAAPLRVRAFERMENGPPVRDVATLAIYDGYGRVSMAGVDTGTNLDWTRTEYDALGRARRVSNPVTLPETTQTPLASSFALWTTNDYDALGRTIQVTYPDHTATVPQYASWSHVGNAVTATDPVGVLRKQWSDALGRLVQVRENSPSGNSLTTGYYDTFYAYDALDNLKTVTQGVQTRSFVYDSLSRLTSETEPEWGDAAGLGTALYEYDANSNLKKRTDARGVVSNYAYDQLNRVASIAYVDGTPGTPGATYSYDAAAGNGKGRRTGMADAGGSAAYQYDAMGRVSRITRTWTGAVTQQGDFAYNRLGGMVSAAWPGISNGPGGTPLTVSWTYDDAGRQKSAKWDNGNGSPQLLATDHSFLYDGNGGLETTRLGNGALETVGYNKPCSRPPAWSRTRPTWSCSVWSTTTASPRPPTRGETMATCGGSTSRRRGTRPRARPTATTGSTGSRRPPPASPAGRCRSPTTAGATGLRRPGRAVPRPPQKL